jgi:hypothetical protein
MRSPSSSEVVSVAALTHNRSEKLDDGKEEAADEDVASTNSGSAKVSPWLPLAKKLFTPVNIALVVALVVGLIAPLRRYARLNRYASATPPLIIATSSPPLSFLGPP